MGYSKGIAIEVRSYHTSWIFATPNRETAAKGEKSEKGYDKRHVMRQGHAIEVRSYHTFAKASSQLSHRCVLAGAW